MLCSCSGSCLCLPWSIQLPSSRLHTSAFIVTSGISSSVAAVTGLVIQRPTQCESIGSLSLVAPTTILIKSVSPVLLSPVCMCESVGRCSSTLCVPLSLLYRLNLAGHARSYSLHLLALAWLARGSLALCFHFRLNYCLLLLVTKLLWIEMATHSANRVPSASEPALLSSLSLEALALELTAGNLTLRGPREARID